MTTTMAVGAELKLQTQIQIALQYVSSHQPSQPGIIVQAQDALLHWEHDMPDAYVVALMSLVGSAHADLGGSNTASAAATLRLAAILSLKAAIVRRWKDRGRGSVQTNLLSENVKIFIRQSMLKLILSGKVDGQLTTNLALNPNEITNQQMELIQDRSLQMNAAALLSKIARMDLPLKFHDLIPSLIEGMKFSRQSICQLQQGHSQYNQHHMTMYRSILYNSMNCLENVLTELSTQRLLVDKKFRNSVAIEYLGTVVESGLIPSIQDLESLFNENESMIGIIEALQFATVSSRTVFHMMIGSFPKLLDGQSVLVDQLLELIHSFLSRWCSLVPGGGTTRYASCCEALGELLHAHCDFIVTLQKAYPTEFVRYLVPFLSLFHRSLMCSVGIERAVNLTDEHVSSNNNISLSDPRLIAFLNFMINVVGATHSDLGATTKEMTAFFTPSLVISLARTLLELMSSHMHPYDDENKECTMIDRVQWQDEPEAFYHYEMQRSSDNDVGSASQNLLLSLVESPFSGQYLISWLMELIAKLASQRLAAEIEVGISTGIDLQVILSALPLGPPSIRCGNEVLGPEICLIFQWDAILTAVGLAGYTFQRHGFDFRSWCETSLCPLLMVLVQETSHQAYLPILRRRIIWLMSCNAHQVPISSYMIGMLTSVLTSGSVQNDLCVRLTTVQALDSLLPQCESDTSVLHSIVQPLATALYQLTNECDEIESRSSCLDLLANLITYVGVNGATLSNEVLDTIVTPLPSIWENATGQNLIFRRSILNILSCIASLLSSAQRAVLHPIALRMIDDCIAKEETMFLVNEALKSWWLFLRLSPTYDELLSTLFFHAADISKDFDHIMILMRITEHYIILGGAEFLNDHAKNIQLVLCNVIGEVRPRGTAYIFLVVEALLRSFPVEGGLLLRDCGVLHTLINSCALSYLNDDECEPDRVIVLYLSALARVYLSAPSTLQSLFPTKFQSGASSFGEDEWISLYLQKFQVAGNGAHGLLFQKLWASLLLSVPSPATIAKSNLLFDSLLYVLRNLSPSGSNVLSYEVGYDEEEDALNIGVESFESMLQEQRSKDIAITFPFHEALSSKLKTLFDEKNSCLNAIDSETLQVLDQLLEANTRR